MACSFETSRNRPSVATVVSCICVVAAIAASSFAKVPPPDPQAVERLPDEVFEAARRGAVVSGVASLLARQSAPDNDTGLVFPPPHDRKFLEWQTKTVRFRRISVDEPVYENITAERLMPQRDEYGEIVGYEKRQVVVQRRVVGMRKVKKLIRDPEGDVEQEIRVAVYDRQGAIAHARGFYGLNGMALYVLARAGLSDDARTRAHARSLADLIDRYGAPDHTWDVAWLVMGYAALPTNSDYEALVRMLASKLIGSQGPARAPGAGLWGPVAIDYAAFLRYFDLELKVREELAKVQAAVDALPENAVADRARADKILTKLRDAQNQVADAMLQTTQMGTRLLAVTKTYKVEEDRALPPLPLYIYNRVLYDTRSTGVVAAALATLEEAGQLPATTTHAQPMGKAVVTPTQTRTVLAAAADAVAAAQDRQTHGWNELNLLTPNTAFARVPPGLFEPLEPAESLPQLPAYDTVESNLEGYSALMHLSRASSAASRRYRAALDEAEARAKAALEHVLGSDLDRKAWDPPFARRVIEIDTLVQTKGQIPIEQEHVVKASEDLTFGLFNAPWVAVESSVALFRPVDDGADAIRNREHFRRLAVRLMLVQGEDGQWRSPRTTAVGVTPSEYAVILQRAATTAYERHTRGHPKVRPVGHQNYLGHFGSTHNQSSPALYPTLAALVVLVEGIGEPIELGDTTVLPDESSSEAASDTESEPTDAPASPVVISDSERVAQQALRPNTALPTLMDALAASKPLVSEPEHPEPPAPPAPVEAAPAEAPPPADAAPTESPEAGERHEPRIEDNLDDILGGGELKEEG